MLLNGAAISLVFCVNQPHKTQENHHHADAFVDHARAAFLQAPPKRWGGRGR